MRIAFLARADTVHENSGGMETQGQLLTEALVKLGHEVALITTAHPEGRESLVENGVTKWFVRDAPSGVYSDAWWDGSLREFTKLHQAQPFDVVFSQSVSGWRYLRAKKQFGVPCIAIMHGTTFRDIKTRFGSVTSLREGLRFSREAAVRLFRYAFRWLYWFRQFDAIIAVSQAVRSSLIKNYFLSPQKVVLVYNGIAVERFQNGGLKSVARQSLGIPETEKVLLYVGRLDREKGVGKLLSALAKIHQPIGEARLVVVGAGPDLENLQASTHELGLTDRVSFVGRISYDKVPQYYQAADIFVLPSEALEGLPMTIIEAMAAGLPVVASRIGGIPEVVENGETGFLVASGDVADLTRALIQLLKEDSLRLWMGAKASSLAAERFSQMVMAKKALRVVDSVLARK